MMDLLFKRYASPFLLLDQLIECGRLSEFIDEFFETVEDEKLWDLYLHSAFLSKSFDDFRRAVRKVPKRSQKMTENELEATIKETKEMLNNFKPQ